MARMLKVIIIIIGVIGLAFYCYMVPSAGKRLAVDDLSGWFVPWLVFISFTAVPIYAGLVIFWRVCADIQRDRSFTEVNASRMKTISILALVDVVYHFTGNIVLLILDMNHPGSLLLSVFVDLVGIAVAIVAAVLAHLVTKAAKLKEDSDLTI